MTELDPIHYCRYYKGEEECPQGIKASFWMYEKLWVDWFIKKDNYLTEATREYLAHNLAEFQNTDDTPISLKAILFNRYSHWLGCDVKGFKKWYTEEYYG